MFRRLMAMVLAALWLTGCGTLRLVDSDVRSFVTAPGVPPGASYRFERLPSQQVDAARQAQLEAMAQQALGKVGLRRDDTGAGYSVQVLAGLRVDPYSPWDRPHGAWSMGWGLGFGVRSGHVMIGGGSPFMRGFGAGDMPYYWRQVSLTIRHLGSGQVVYETHATHDGRWSDSDAILPAMLEAALKGFPNPPPGPRRINLEIPR